MALQVALEVDARNKACPMPLLLLRQALSQVSEGNAVRLLATDPGAQRDIPIFAEQCGHEVVLDSSQKGVVIYTLTKGIRR
ncbi:MAG: sulfurtransferase TusA family protein [Gammaproteobacteria bacterium]